MNIYDQIKTMSDEMAGDLTAQRRDFHKYAEPGWFEMRTSSIIARKLTELGYEVLVGDQVCKKDSRMGVPSEEKLEEQYERAVAQGADPEFVKYTKGGMTGVIGILRCGEGPTVAMRFDIDALGVFEEHDPSHRPAKEGFNSVNEGFMHACGHDGHATIGLGVAKVLMSIKDQLHGTVKLIFQPAEEGVRGAKSIVDNGHLDGVDYLIGSHVILNLYAIPRHSGGVSRVNVGTVVAGSGRNVIADEAKMEIEVRGETTEINEYMKNYAVNIIESAAKMHGCTCEMKLMGAANSLTSSEALMERVKRVCEEDLHLPVAKEMSSKNGGSEDVSYMMNRVQEQGGQATFMRVLTHEAGPGHSRIFDIDEQVLPNAVKIFCGVVYDIMH